MAKIAYLSRQALVTQGSGSSVTSGADFGVKNVSGFTRITGLASIVGSASIRMRTGINETGPYFVNSTWNVLSGTNILDTPNYGSWTYFDVTVAQSLAPAQSPIFSIYGEPVR